MYDLTIISAPAFDAEYGFVGFKTPASSVKGLSVSDSPYSDSIHALTRAPEPKQSGKRTSDSTSSIYAIVTVTHPHADQLLLWYVCEFPACVCVY